MILSFRVLNAWLALKSSKTLLRMPRQTQNSMVGDSLLQFSVIPKPTLCRLINSIIQSSKWVLSIAEGNVRWTNTSLNEELVGWVRGVWVAKGVRDSLVAWSSHLFPFPRLPPGLYLYYLEQNRRKISLSSPPNDGMGSPIPFHSGPISTETGINFGPVVIIAIVHFYLHFAPNYVIVAMNLCFF